MNLASWFLRAIAPKPAPESTLTIEQHAAALELSLAARKAKRTANVAAYRRRSVALWRAARERDALINSQGEG